MSYVQHTECIQMSGFQPLSYKAQPAVEMLVLFGGTLAWVATLIPIVMGMPLCALHALGLMLYGGIFGYCNWWLYYRLVCLGGDRCAIGMLLSVEPATGKDWPGSYDTDYSVNLLVAHTQPGDSLAATAATKPYGELIGNTDIVKSRADVVFDPEPVTPEGGTDAAKSFVLHAEFEGAGVWIMFLSSAASLILVVAACFVCMVPVWGWIASLILELLAFLATLFGHLGAGSDGAEGNATDVNPDLGVLHAAQGDGIGPADVLYVYGTWVFDGGHQDEGHGWNELHPIKEAVKVGTWTGDWATSIDSKYASYEDVCARLHDAIGTAQQPATIAEQARPEHQWIWHPLIDGCENSASPPPPPPPPIR